MDRVKPIAIQPHSKAPIGFGLAVLSILGGEINASASEYYRSITETEHHDAVVIGTVKFHDARDLIF